MSTAHGDEPGARKADFKTDITDRSAHQDHSTEWNQSATTRGRKQVKDKQKMQAVRSITQEPQFFWDLDKNAPNSPTGWVTK